MPACMTENGNISQQSLARMVEDVCFFARSTQTRCADFAYSRICRRLKRSLWPQRRMSGYVAEGQRLHFEIVPAKIWRSEFGGGQVCMGMYYSSLDRNLSVVRVSFRFDARSRSARCGMDVFFAQEL